MLNEKIRALRNANNMTQENLAERLGVSRQAITKWETGLGTPDVTNIHALATLFNVTVDELLSGDCSAKDINKDNVSRTEFDIFNRSDFQMDIGTASTLDITTSHNEKVVVEIRSDLDKESYKLAKVKLSEGRHVDLVVVEYKDEKRYLDIKTDKDISRQEAKKHVFVSVVLPENLADHIEIEGNVQRLSIHDMESEHHLEFDGKASEVMLSNLNGHLELTSDVDMEITYDGSLRQLDINQIRCISNLYLPKGAQVDVYSKGRASKVLFEGYVNNPESENKVELAGFKSELTVRGN